MRTLLAALLAATAAATTVALASGGPPPPDPGAAAPNTVVAVGGASVDVQRPQRLTDARIARAARVAREAALAPAVAAARAEAVRLAAAASLTLGRTVGVAHYDPPYFGQDTGRFGVDRWCGRAYAGRGKPRKWRCFVPARQTANVRITVEAG